MNVEGSQPFILNRCSFGKTKLLGGLLYPKARTRKEVFLHAMVNLSKLLGNLLPYFFRNHGTFSSLGMSLLVSWRLAISMSRHFSWLLPLFSTRGQNHELGIFYWLRFQTVETLCWLIGKKWGFTAMLDLLRLLK